MRIESDVVSLSGIAATRNAQAERRPEQVPSQTAGVGSGPDRVELSLGAMRVEELKKAATVEPPARTDKFDAIRQQIADGTYQVDSRLVAGKMLGLVR
ncbi:MAG: flagellar biosynthesis anti-sigma factor FlgM [Desulfuromonadales bacterium]|nr:MAG: flagellar biosynthesis anti-sigma factor FlgM [Desulfuromonadales bacterium]